MRLKSLLNPKGGEQHNQARQCVCAPRLLSDEACSSETVRELFEECSGRFALALHDASITQSAHTTDTAVVGGLKDTVMAFMTCKLLMGEPWQSSQPYISLLGALKSLAEVLIQAAHSRVHRAEQLDSNKAFNIKLADPLIRKQDWPEFMLFGTLCKAAWTYADSALKVCGNHTQGSAFSSQGVNATFTCCALVYACKLLGDLTDTLTKQPDLLIAFNSANGNEKKQKPLPAVEKEQKVARARPLTDSDSGSCIREHTESKASSFLSRVGTEWSSATMQSDPLQMCTRVFQKEPGFLDDARHLCEGLKLWDPDEAFEPDDPIFRKLFQDTEDNLGRALWEFFQRDCCDPYIKEVANETEGTIKVLMQCLTKEENWVASEQLGNLSRTCRLMTEALAMAAFMKFCYKQEEDLIKPNNKQGHKKGLSDLAGDLMKLSAPVEANILGALCKAAHNTVCDADLHYTRGPNKGNCIIIGCRAIVFACYIFIVIMDLSNVQDTSSQETEARFTDFMMDLKAQTEAPIDPRPHFSIFVDKYLKLEDMYSRAHDAKDDVESTLGALHDSFGDKILLGDLSSDQIQKNKIITAAQDIYRTSVNYVTNIDTGEWLYRILTDKDDKHYKDIGAKLAKLVSLLREAMCKKDWPLQDKQKLEHFEQKVAGLENRRKAHAVARQEVRQAFKDQAVYLKELQEFFDDKKEAALQEIRINMNEEALKQAAAFARAKFDRSGTHHEIHHPDVLVLWHRGEELKQKWHAGWGEFLSHFPSKLWLNQEVRSKVEAMKHNLKHPLTGAGSEDDEESSAEPQVSIDSINRVFEWRVGKRVTLLDAVKSCQSSLRSQASSEGTHSSGKESALESGKLDVESWQDLADKLENEVQCPALLGRDETIAQASDILTKSSGKRHLLLLGPGGIGKTSLGEAVSHQLVEGGILVETGIVRINLFTAHTADEVYAALCSGLRISVKGKIDDMKHEVVRKLRRATDLAASRGVLLFLDSSEIPLATRDAASALADVLQHVLKLVPKAMLLMASRTVKSHDPHGGNGVHPFHHAPPLTSIFQELVVPPLSLEAGVQILRRGFRSTSSEHNMAAMKLAKQCECIPLRLRLAAGILSSGQANYEDIQHALSEVPRHGSIEAALLKWHDPVHLKVLYSLSLFATAFSTEQADYMLDDIPDTAGTLQELYGRRLILTKPAMPGEQLWGMHTSVQAAVQGLGMAATLAEPAVDWQQYKTSTREKFAWCMTAELATCAKAPERERSRIALAQQANMFAALEPGRNHVGVRTAISREILREWSVVCRGGWAYDVGKVAGLLLPSLEQLCGSAARLLKEKEEGQCAGREEECGDETTEQEELRHMTPGEWVSSYVDLEDKGNGHGPQLVLLCDGLEPSFIRLQLVKAELMDLHAVLLRSQGKSKAAAAELLRQVSELRREVLGAQHPETLKGMYHYANSLSGLGKHAAAAKMKQQVLELQQKVLGAEHPDTLKSKYSLASSLGSLGQHAAAEKMHQEVLDLRRKVLGDEHSYTLKSMHSLAVSLGNLGKHEASAEMDQRVLELRRKVLGPVHPLTVTSMNSYATSLRKLGKHTAAVDILRQVPELRRRRWGAEHPLTLNSMDNLASSLGNLGDHAAASEIYQQVLELRRKVQGAEHPQTLASMNNLAISLSGLGNHAAAAETHQQVLELRCKVLGAEHPLTAANPKSLATSLHNLACSLGNLGKHEAAAETHQQVLELRRRVLGEEHPHTLESMHSLAISLGNLGKHAAAAEIKQQMLELRHRGVHGQSAGSLSKAHPTAATVSLAESPAASFFSRASAPELQH